MGTYLKFHGKSTQNCRQQVTAWTSTGSVVLTCFVRILQIPVGTAPVIGIADSAVGCYHGIWLSGRNAVPAAGGFAVNGQANVGGATENEILNLDVTSGGSPLRMGRIYKLQSIMAWDAAGGGFRMSFNVDGVQIAESGFGGTGLFVPASNPVMRVLGQVESVLDRLTNVTALVRHAHAEVFQAMFEIDRTISFDGAGVITTVDADSDPFTDLVFSGMAADGALWVMDEGSGNPQDTSGNARHATSSGLVWAGAGEPTFPSLGLAQWDLEHVEGLLLRESDAPDAVPQPDPGPGGPVGDETSGEIRLAPTPRWWWEDGEQINQFTPTTQLTTSSVEKFEGDTSIRSSGSAAINNLDVLPNPVGTNKTYWFRAFFFDPGGTTGTRLQRIVWHPSVGNALISIGVGINVSATNYMTRVTGAPTPNQASSVAFSVGWHEFLVFWDNPGGGGNDTIRMYIDRTLVRTEAGTAVATPGRLGFRERGVVGSNDHGYWDQFDLGVEGLAGGGPLGSVFSQLVESSGSIILQLLQPTEGVKQFTAVTINDEQAGATSFESGTITYAFRHSTDGGATWGGSTALSNANLQALKCVSNGDDVLEFTPTFTSDLDDMGSGAFRQLRIEYEPAIAIEVLEPGQRFHTFHESELCDSEIAVV